MSTELSNIPENYIPMFNVDTGTYEDNIPSTSKVFLDKYKNGVCCCNGNIFTKRVQFKNHLNTITHIKWLESFKIGLRMDNWAYHIRESNKQLLNEVFIVIPLLRTSLLALTTEEHVTLLIMALVKEAKTS